MRKHTLALSLVLGTLPVLGYASGNHPGWCIGTNNPHGASGCGASSTTTGTGAGAVTPATVPSANQLPGTGTGATPGQSPAIIYVDPKPQQVITGYGPVTVIQGQTPPPVTGTGPVPITVSPIPQTVFTGVGPVPPLQTTQSPSFTGTGQLPIFVQPLPPTVFTGTGPVPPIQTAPGPSFTGQGLPMIVVIPQPPVTVTGYAPVSAAIIVQPNPQGGFTGIGAVPVPAPNARPNMVPTPVPNAIPQAVPQMVPGRITAPPAVGTLQHTMVQRPKPRPSRPGKVAGTGGIKHAPQHQKAAVGQTLVTRNAGRQAAHDSARFAAADGGNWNCLASGHGKRTTYADRQAQASGALRHVGAVDVMGRDLPAVHPRHSGCIIAVKRREKSSR